ncbi:MAG: hypothetical protein H6581_11760 [Bacteroidia bacterium]|nr:hypothetical protein [Bacteroidia bacterium]
MNIIPHLITQDFRHHHFLQSLRALGLDDGGQQDLDILSAVAEMMQVPQGPLRDAWEDVYVNWLDRAAQLPLQDSEAGFADLAGRCYLELQELGCRV